MCVCLCVLVCVCYDVHSPSQNNRLHWSLYSSLSDVKTGKRDFRSIRLVIWAPEERRRAEGVTGTGRCCLAECHGPPPSSSPLAHIRLEPSSLYKVRLPVTVSTAGYAHIDIYSHIHTQTHSLAHRYGLYTTRAKGSDLS